MTDREAHQQPRPDQEAPRGHDHGGDGGHSRWMMIACCIPMLAIAIILAAAGVVSVGFIVVAIGCTVMMALMMGAMSHGGGPGAK
jgi:hypothetical protein